HRPLNCCSFHSACSLEHLPGGKVTNQSKICFEKIVRGQVNEVGPAYLFKDFVFELSLECVHLIEAQLHDSSAPVLMPHLRNLLTDHWSYSKFLFKFSFQSRLWLFARFDLSPGKFPFERHGLMLRALANKNLAIFKDECSPDLPHRSAPAMVAEGFSTQVVKVNAYIATLAPCGKSSRV